MYYRKSGSHISEIVMEADKHVRRLKEVRY